MPTGSEKFSSTIVKLRKEVNIAIILVYAPLEVSFKRFQERAGCPLSLDRQAYLENDFKEKYSNVNGYFIVEEAAKLMYSKTPFYIFVNSTILSAEELADEILKQIH